MIITRKDFIAIMVYEGGLDESLLFMPETDQSLNPLLSKPPAQWFVNINPINLHQTRADVLHHWNKKHLKGSIFCYSSSDTDEWWGFTEKDDVFFWLLRWG